MAGEPAIDKVLVAVQTLLSAETDLTVEIDHPDDQAFGNAELEPGVVNLHHVVTRRQYASFGEHSNCTRHETTIDADLMVSVDDTATIGARLRENDALVVEALATDPYLGGLLAEQIEPVSLGGDDDVRADEGGITVRLKAVFFTPLGDPRTIIGAAGLVP